MNKDRIKEILETVKEGLPEDGEGMRGGKLHSECCCPLIVLYLIDARCLNINNAGCPGWQFCGVGYGPVNTLREG